MAQDASSQPLAASKQPIPTISNWTASIHRLACRNAVTGTAREDHPKMFQESNNNGQSDKPSFFALFMCFLDIILQRLTRPSLAQWSLHSLSTNIALLQWGNGTTFDMCACMLPLPMCVQFCNFPWNHLKPPESNVEPENDAFQNETLLPGVHVPVVSCKCHMESLCLR